MRSLSVNDPTADSLKSLFTGKINPEQVQLLNRLGNYFVTDSPSIAFTYYLKSFNYSKDLGIDSLTAFASECLGNIKLNADDYSEANKHLRNALTYYEKSKNESKVAETTKQLGLSEYYLGNYKDAITNYQASLRFFIKVNNEQETADIYQNIGLVHHELENIKDALSYYRKSLVINEKLDNKKNIAALTQNIGLLYMRDKNYEAALENIRKSLKIYSEINNSEGIGISLSNIGWIYQNQGQYTKSLTNYQRSFQVFDSINYLFGKLWALHNIGTSYSDLKKHDKALEYYFQSLGLSEQSGHIQGILNNYEAISNSYADKNDYKKAFEYYKLYISINDSISSEETKNKISEMEAFYKFELLNAELSAKSDELLQQKKQIYLFFAGTVILFVLLVMLIFAYSQKRKAETDLREHQNSLEKLVEQKTEELKNQINERKVAEESDRLKSAFLANMSHEFRTPLNAIIAFSNFIRDPHLPEGKKSEYVNYIMTAGESLLRLIDDIIDIAKIEAREISISNENCNITRLCDELHKVFEELKKKKGKNHLELFFTPYSLKKSIIIKTDPHRLKQILTNLLENALKYTNYGFVEFGYKKRDKFIQFYIKDSGIGIPKEKFNYIFERFSQLDYSTNKEFGGTGLGLAITKNLVRMLGGEIWLESQENKGTVFYFTIPYSEVEITTYVPGINIEKPQAYGLIDQYNWQGKTILIAEDEDLNYKVLESALARTNALIIRARNGLEAVRKFSEHPVDMVLMDIQMPRMDGYEATREIKRINRKIPVIAQTSFAMEGEKEKCIMAGCDNYLSKPLNLNELFLLIENFFNTLKV
jgi:signal transduction histidine kinase/CheY-like chemotaxis protein